MRKKRTSRCSCALHSHALASSEHWNSQMETSYAPSEMYPRCITRDGRPTWPTHEMKLPKTFSWSDATAARSASMKVSSW